MLHLFVEQDGKRYEGDEDDPRYIFGHRFTLPVLAGVDQPKHFGCQVER